jgi:hypothetical protein
MRRAQVGNKDAMTIDYRRKIKKPINMMNRKHRQIMDCLDSFIGRKCRFQNSCLHKEHGNGRNGEGNSSRF